MNKLVMINVTDHELEYGTIISVRRELSKSYSGRVAENDKKVIILKSYVEDV